MPATLIQNITSADAQSVTFTSIPTTYNNLRLFVRASARDNTSGNNNLAVRINGSSGLRYGWVAGRSYNPSTSTAGTSLFRSSDIQQSAIFLTPGGSNISAPTTGAFAILDFANYAGTTNDKNVNYYYSNPTNGGGTYQPNSEFIIGLGQTADSAAITQIQIFSDSRANLLWRASLWGY
jgi:hypothetical protein